MYRGEGRVDDSSSCRYVGIDMGGSGIVCGIGEGGSAPDSLLVLFCNLFEVWPISRGSGRADAGRGFLLGDVWPRFGFVYEAIRPLATG